VHFCKRGAAITAIAILALSAVSGTATARVADPEWPNCPVDEFCIYEGPNGTGRVVQLRTGTFDVSQQGLSNGGRSAWNRTTSDWCVSPAKGRLLAGLHLIPNGRMSNVAVWAAHRPDWLRCWP
jgi:hypothetical protein